MTIIIRDAAAGDEAAFRALWADYLDFYRTSLPPEVTDRTWARIMGPDTALFALIGEIDGAAGAFAVCVVHDGSWVASPICYLEDLFVAEPLRGRGVGRRMIEALVARVRARGWSRLYWHTEADNHQARALYDRFTPADGVRYRISA